jgi:hypothetical protein
MEKTTTYWESAPPKTKNINIEYIQHFDARGMRRVYGRCDQLGPHHTFNMNIWLTSSGRLLMRLWSHCQDIDERSFEIKGLDASEITKPIRGSVLEDTWVPDIVRNTFNKWIDEEF